MLEVPSADLREDAEWRIVDDDATVRVFFVLVVAARFERAYNRPALDPVFIRHPLQDRVIHIGGGIAVIRGFFRFEFVDERLVLQFALLHITNLLGGVGYMEKPRHHNPVAPRQVWSGHTG